MKQSSVIGRFIWYEGFKKESQKYKNQALDQVITAFKTQPKSAKIMDSYYSLQQLLPSTKGT